MYKKSALFIILFSLFFSLSIVFSSTVKASFWSSLFGKPSSVLGEDDEKDSEDTTDSEQNDEKDSEDKADEIEMENEQEQEQEHKEVRNRANTEETIQNKNGTTTTIKREIEGNQEKVQMRTYDATGNKIGEVEYEGDDKAKELQVKNYNAYTLEQLKNLKLQTSDGKILELQVNGREGATESKVEYDSENKELKVKVKNKVKSETETETENMEEDSELKIKVGGDGFKLTQGEYNALLNYPISVNEETGEVYVTTGNGSQIILEEMPESIVNRARLADSVKSVDKVELNLVNKDTADSSLEYTVKGTKSQKLLGVFSVNIPISLKYSAQNGDLLDSSQTTLNKILDLLSF